MTDLYGQHVTKICDVGSSVIYPSKDWTRIVFSRFDSRENAYHIMTLEMSNGRPKDLGEGYCPRLSADGRSIACYLGASKQISLMDFDGSNTRLLPGQGEVGDGTDMCFSSDGTKLAFCRVYRSVLEGKMRLQYAIAVYDLLTGQVQEVTDRSTGMTEMQSSPDGRSLSYLGGCSRDLGIYVVSFGDGRHERLTPSRS
jgi:Tol biopolymer transport system component